MGASSRVQREAARDQMAFLPALARGKELGLDPLAREPGDLTNLAVLCRVVLWSRLMFM